jgi:hypothetical protein
MANLAAKTANSAAGVAVPITTAAAGGGDAFDNDGRTLFFAKNASGAPITVTFDSLVPSNYGTDVNGGGAVAAGETRAWGPFDPSRFNDVNNRVGVTYSGVTSLTVDVVRF